MTRNRAEHLAAATTRVKTVQLPSRQKRASAQALSWQPRPRSDSVW